MATILDYIIRIKGHDGYFVLINMAEFKREIAELMKHEYKRKPTFLAGGERRYMVQRVCAFLGLDAYGIWLDHIKEELPRCEIRDIWDLEVF